MENVLSVLMCRIMSLKLQFFIIFLNIYNQVNNEDTKICEYNNGT